MTQCHCFGECYFSDPKSQIISMVILPGRQACQKILINYLSMAQLCCLICWQTMQQSGALLRAVTGAICTQRDSVDLNLRASAHYSCSIACLFMSWILPRTKDCYCCCELAAAHIKGKDACATMHLSSSLAFKREGCILQLPHSVW